MKICVVTPNYGLSGVPLAQVRFARALARRGHEVDLLIGNNNGGHRFEPPEGVNTLLMGASTVRAMFVPLMQYLRKARPQVVFSAEDHLNTITLMAGILTGSKAKFSGSSRVTPYDTYSNKLFSKRWVLKQLARAVAWRADAQTCVSKDMVDQYRTIFPNSRHVNVYNIVQDADSQARMMADVDHPWLLDKKGPVLVAAGTLAPWKGFEYLIDAMQQVNHPGRPRLIIIGGGPDREALQEQIDKLQLGDVIDLVGFKVNPLSYFSRSDVFVLSSIVEGMPNVLVEAMMCGCTPVAANCPTGPRELLQDGRIGYLVETKNPTALARGIEQALDNPVPDEVLQQTVEPFTEDAVIGAHFRLLGLSEHPS